MTNVCCIKSAAWIITIIMAVETLMVIILIRYYKGTHYDRNLRILSENHEVFLHTKYRTRAIIARS